MQLAQAQQAITTFEENVYNTMHIIDQLRGLANEDYQQSLDHVYAWIERQHKKITHFSFWATARNPLSSYERAMMHMGLADVPKYKLDTLALEQAIEEEIVINHFFPGDILNQYAHQLYKINQLLGTKLKLPSDKGYTNKHDQAADMLITLHFIEDQAAELDSQYEAITAVIRAQKHYPTTVQFQQLVDKEKEKIRLLPSANVYEW